MPYLGPPVLSLPTSTATDLNGAANSVVEGAAVNTLVGITANATSQFGFPVTYSLSADSSGGGFRIDPNTGVVTIADPTRINFETAAGHAYTITVDSSDGFGASSQSFTISITDVAPTTPVDANGAANSVAEGAAVNTLVGITASSNDINGPGVTWSLSNDAGGAFKIDAITGVVSVADPTKIDFETTAPGHTLNITAVASDDTLTSAQNFTISVTDVALAAPVDSNAAANTVIEGSGAGTTVGLTAFALDPNGPATTYSLIGDTSLGGFTINAATGVVTVADPAKIDFESTAPGHTYSITVQAANGLQTTTQSFTIGVADAAPTVPVDNDAAANNVVEAAANGSLVGITALSTDVNGPPVTYALTGDTSGGGFTINAVTGVVTVADSTKIDFETAAGHAYTITVQSSDGQGGVSTQTFLIGVTDVAPSTPIDGNAGANVIAEGAAAGSAVGITASATDINGGTLTYSLTGDTSGGGFTINATTGVVTVADPTKIDYETSPGHAYTITAQASDGALSSSQTFTIGVTDVAPSTPVDSDTLTANSVAEGAANGSTVGVTASSLDPNGPAVTYALTGDTSGGGFTINATTGVVTVADSTKIDFESAAGHAYTVTAQASDGTLASSQTFTITVTDVAPSTPVDSNGAANQVANGALAGTTVGVTASSTDVNGPAVTYSLVGDTSGGGFTINAATGVVTVADPSKIVLNPADPKFTVTVDSSDGTLHSQQTFDINVVVDNPPVANDDSVSATEKGGLNNAVAGVDPAGNVILGTGAAGSVTDTDVEDPSNALTVVAVHTGPEGGSILAGTVGLPLTGAHGTLTLGTNGAYTYQVNQTDSAVQALHTSADAITDVFNYTIQDTGGLQDTATLTITIHGADDLPQAVADTGTMTEDDAPTSFNVIVNDTQDPDSTATNAITVGPGGITVTGPAGETFANTDATASIIANQVQVSLVNSHFQQLALGEHATVTVPYTLTGDAGETSTANLVVTVNGVNDVPVAADDGGSITEDQVGTFTVLSNDTLDADHGAPNNVTTGAISNLVAPSGENIDTSDIGLSVNGSNQVIVTLGSDFQHMKDGETSTFDVAYTLHGDQPGDTSTATLHVTVTGANDAPVAANVTFNGANSAIGNTDLVVNDPADGAPDPAGPQKTISGSLLSLATDVDGPGPLVVVAGTFATANGGTVTMQADGDFTYKPAVGFTGPDSFTYQVSDQNPGVAGTGTGTVTINVATPKVWYVNADSATDGDGSSENPFNTLSHFNGVGGVDGAGDTIVLETSSTHYTGGLTLENNEQLLSQSAGVTINGTTLFAASGANAVLDGGLVLASGNNVQGVDFGANAGNFAVSGSSVGTLHLNDATSGVINNASGGGISIGGAGNVLNVDFNSVTTGGGTNGIALTNASGTFHAHGGTISNASGADISLNGGTLAFTQDGAVSDATGTAVSIQNMTGGAQDFNGAITGASIALATNAGATMSFDGGMTLTSGTANAFSATGGGTLTVTGTNHLTSTTGTALNISNTTIGAGNVTFHDISSNGGSNDGIILDTTGSSGGLHVTGDGSASGFGNGSGGVIQNKTGADLATTTGNGIYLNNTSNVQLANMNLHDFQNNGIVGFGVTNLQLTHSTLGGTIGDAASSFIDAPLKFGISEGLAGTTNGLFGTSTIDHADISGGITENVDVFNQSGTYNLTISNSSVHDNSAALGNDGIEIETQGTSTGTITVGNSAFNNNKSQPVHASAIDSSNMTVTIDSNTLTRTVQGNEGFVVAGGGNSHVNVFITNNNISGISGVDIFAGQAAGNATSGSDFRATISGNTVNHPTTALNSAIIAFLSSTVGQVANSRILIDGNTVTENGTNGVSRGIFVDTPDANTTPNVDVTVSNNVVHVGDNTAGINGIAVQGRRGTMDADIFGNTVDFPNGTPAGVVGIRERQASPGTANIETHGTGATSAAVLAANNPASTTEIVGTVGIVAGGTVKLPSDPLFAAAGGVQASSPTPGETHLSQAELDAVVAAAIAQWAHAGASVTQLAALSAITFSVADLSGNIVGLQSPGHITIDTDAAGHGWFIDPTPGDNFEFAHAANATGTDLFTDPSNAAAGHLDLLTTVMHEMGHELGLPDLTAAADANDLMYITLVDGERRLPDATDVAATGVTPSVAITAAANQGPPTFTNANSGNDTIDAGHGGGVLFGGAGADTFVFASINVKADVTPAVTHVMDYSFAEGDRFDFSALTSQFHASGVDDNLIVRAVEDASGTFATLQVHKGDASGASSAGNWVDVAQIGGAHTGDILNVLVDSHAAVHLAQIHVGLLV